MNQTEQQIAIAKFCGWKLSVEFEGGHGYREEWIKPNKSGDSPKPPSYLTDLNACRQFEEQMTLRDLEKYCEALEHVPRGKAQEDVTNPSMVLNLRILMASPEHRCETFLRALNLWKD